jgi:MFS family permease
LSITLPATATKSRPWGALVSSFLSWMFDAMDLQLFTMILFPSVSELLGSHDVGRIAGIGGIIVACKLFAWGLGGIVFGVIADRIGRARTMAITVLIYSVFTGLSALAGTWWELAILQALAGIGIGGEWAAGAALVAETWPERSRSRAMQAMQLAFAFGFFMAALLNLLIGPFGWRWVLLAGASPAVVTIFVRLFVPEPERWVRAKAARSASEGPWQTFTAIFTRQYRRVTIVGVLVSLTMMVGSWGTSTLLPTWIHEIVGPAGAAQIGRITSQSFMIVNAGALAGYLTLIWLTEAVGRRWSYFLFCLGAAVTNVVMFTYIRTMDAYMPFMLIYGYFAIGGFGTFAVYLPELFPTRIRATGQGFCWNMARIVTGAGPLTSGLLVGTFGSIPRAGMMVAWIYVVGLIAIWFGPETKGRVLPD